MAISEIEKAVQLMDNAWTLRRESMNLPADAYRGALSRPREMLADSVETFRREGAQRELVHALRRLGHVEEGIGDTSAARMLYEEAVTVSREIGDPLVLAHAVRHLGDIHWDLKNLAEAESCFDESLTLYRSHKDPPALDYANALRPTALLMEELGRFEEAKALWRQARDLYGKSHIQAGVDECTKHLAQLGETEG